MVSNQSYCEGGAVLGKLRNNNFHGGSEWVHKLEWFEWCVNYDPSFG